jgi:very-short-patch-repair endonuclease
MENISKLINLKDRYALITGATGSLGLSIASTLAELGANLILTDLKESDLEALKQELEKKWNVNIVCKPCDLEIQEERIILIDWVNNNFDELNILINNAAFVGSSNLKGWTEKFEDQFKVGRYYLDLYFPEYKIVVECDENGHADRKPYKERERMDFVNEKLNLTDDNWIRYNPDAEDFDISKVIGKIYTRINLLKSVQIQDLLQHQSQSISLPAPESDDEIISSSSRPKTAPKKLCGKCNVTMSVRKFYLRAEKSDFVLQEPADGNKYTEEEIAEIQSKYRSSCIKCYRKADLEVRNTLKKNPLLNKSECKSCNTIFKNDFFYINEDKTVFDECIVCYIKNNNLPESKQCIDCLKILPLSGYHVHTGTVLRNQCKTCRNTKNQQARKSVMCEFCNAEIKHKENLAPHQETESCKKARNL